MNVTPKLSTSSLVIQSVKDLITSGELKPGSRLPIENVLAAQLGVSRGMLREGIRALAAMGIVETRQGDGTYVTSLEPALLTAPMAFIVDTQQPGSAAQLLAVRRVLETEAVDGAASRIDAAALAEATAVLDGVDALLADESADQAELALHADVAFHRIIARASGNPVLEALIDAIASRTLRARMWRAHYDQGSIAEAQMEHRNILDALRRGNPEAARIRMAVHLLGIEQYIEAHKSDASRVQ